MENQKYMNAIYALNTMSGNINNMNTMGYQMPQPTNLMWGAALPQYDQQIQPLYNSDTRVSAVQQNDGGLK